MYSFIYNFTCINICVCDYRTVMRCGYELLPLRWPSMSKQNIWCVLISYLISKGSKERDLHV